MGVCASCLGLNRRSPEEPSETERLLYNEPEQTQYGTTGQGANLPEPDPEELRRQREVLERICAETSNELIDVLHHSTVAKGSKLANEYASLLNQHFATHEDTDDERKDVEDEEAWLGATGDAERESWGLVKGFTPGGLVISLNEPTVSRAATKKTVK